MDMKYNLSCPRCGHKITLILRNMTQGNTVPCPSCSLVVKFADGGGRDAQEALDSFERSLKDLSRRLNR
jgi:DNA-directed RNA polymerase subunit RPC12/RpoP